jgi:hypothetical protein
MQYILLSKVYSISGGQEVNSFQETKMCVTTLNHQGM